MAFPKKVSDEIIIEAYTRLHNVWEVAKEVGICGQSVHERVCKLGIVNKNNILTEEEKDKLKDKYELYISAGRLEDLSKEFNRNHTYLCTQAKKLGLTNICRKKIGYKTAEERTRIAVERIKKHGPPKGSPGISPSKEMRKILSEKSTASQKLITENGGRSAIIQKIFKTKLERYGTLAPKRTKATWKLGYRTIGGRKMFFRSRWEANYARYLQYLFDADKITSWSYESDTFWFKNISDNIICYRPDFKVEFLDGRIEYHEVKGWYDDRTIYKLKKFNDEYKDVTLVMIDKKWFRGNKSLEHELVGWENQKNIQSTKE